MKTKYFCSYYKCIICKDAVKIKFHILKRKFFMMENSDLENMTEKYWRVERLLGCVLTQFFYWLASGSIGQSPDTSAAGLPVK